MKSIAKRPLMFCCVGIIVGVFIGCLAHSNLLVAIIIPSVFLIGGIVLSFFGKKYLIFAAIAISVCIGVTAFTVDRAVTYDGEIENVSEFSGRVCKKASNYVLLDDLIFDGAEIRGKCKLKNASYEVGEIIVGKGNVNSLEFDPFESDEAYSYSEEIYYEISYCKVSEVKQGNSDFFERLRQKLCSRIEENLSEEDAGIVESLILGEKALLSYEDSENFRLTGLSHAFALSGLHIGFLMMLIYGLLRIVRVKPAPRLIILVILLMFYGLLTGFTAGVKRAIIMTVVSNVAVLARRKNDDYTSLMLAAALILLLNPKEIVSVGFWMSFTSISGIFTFQRPIYRFLTRRLKAKLYRIVAESVSLTVSATVFTLPVSVSTFGSFAPFAALGNLIILPLITVTFLYISVCGVATGIHGMAGIMFRPAKYPIWLIREISTLISKFPGAEIGVTGGFASAFFYVFLMLILNPRMRMNKKVRIVSASICGVVTMFCFGFGV